MVAEAGLIAIAVERAARFATAIAVVGLEEKGRIVDIDLLDGSGQRGAGEDVVDA